MKPATLHTSPAPAAVSRRMPLIIVAVVLAMVALIEWQHPYFFLQDDNRGQNLPYYVQNIRAVAAGEFPFFNFHQHLGTPLFSCLQPASLYPVNYLALLSSKLVWGHYFAAMDLIAVIHLLVAALGMYRLARLLGASEAGSFLAAISWPFCGFVFSVGNSWIAFTGYAAWLPWILYSSIRLMSGFSWRIFALFVATRVMAMFIGHPQMLAYLFLFDSLVVALLRWSGAQPQSAVAGSQVAPVSRGRFWLDYAGGYLLTLMLSLPLLLPAYHQMKLSQGRSQALSWEEYSDFGYGFINWLQGLVAPLAEPYLKLFCNQHFISHIGFVTLLGLVAALWSLRSAPPHLRRLILVFVALAGGAFLWAHSETVQRVIYHIPILNRFRMPFKLVFFTSFFMVLVASFGFDVLTAAISRVLRVGGNSGRLIVAGLLLANCLGFVWLYSSGPQRMFSLHYDDVPFSEPLQEQLSRGRIVSIAVDEFSGYGSVVYGNSAPLIGFNYATLLGLYHFGGYEVLLSARNAEATLGLNYFSLFNPPRDTIVDISAFLPIEYLRRWGVAWYVFYHDIPLVNPGGLVPAFSDRFRNILHDPYARPLVYWSDTLAGVGIEHAFGANSVAATTNRPDGGVLVVNVLYNPFFSATVDGQPARVMETEDSQMAVEVPAGNHRVVLRYVDPHFYRGLALAVAALAVCLAIAWFSRRKLSLSVDPADSGEREA